MTTSSTAKAQICSQRRRQDQTGLLGCRDRQRKTHAAQRDGVERTAHTDRARWQRECCHLGRAVKSTQDVLVQLVANVCLQERCKRVASGTTVKFWKTQDVPVHFQTITDIKYYLSGV